MPTLHQTPHQLAVQEEKLFLNLHDNQAQHKEKKLFGCTNQPHFLKLRESQGPVSMLKRYVTKHNTPISIPQAHP